MILSVHCMQSREAILEAIREPFSENTLFFCLSSRELSTLCVCVCGSPARLSLLRLLKCKQLVYY